MRARYYNVSIMRFINQDVVHGNLSDSQSLNRFAYVEGNPINFLDPFGLEKWRSAYYLEHELFDGWQTALMWVDLGATIGLKVPWGPFNYFCKLLLIASSSLEVVFYTIDAILYLSDLIDAIEQRNSVGIIESVVGLFSSVSAGYFAASGLNNLNKVFKYPIEMGIEKAGDLLIRYIFNIYKIEYDETKEFLYEEGCL